MGKSGGHEKKKVITKGEAKTKSLANKEYRDTSGYREQGNQLLGQFAQGQFGVGGSQNSPLGTQQMMNDFAPIHQEARRNFQQQVIPDIQHAFGRGSKTSSALNQALVSAGQNLQGQLSGQFAQYGLADRARQQEMQFNAANQLANTGYGGAQLGLAKDKYAFVGQGPSGVQRAGAVALPVAGGIAGGIFGGPAGAAAGVSAGSAASNAFLK